MFLHHLDSKLIRILENIAHYADLRFVFTIYSLTSTTDPQTLTEHVYVGNNAFNWAVFGTMTGVGGGMIFMIVLCVYFKKGNIFCRSLEGQK